MSIIIGADVVPIESNIGMFTNGDVDSLVGQELYEFLERADYVICNLEVPLSDRTSPILKYGPNLVAPTSCIKGIKQLGIDLVTLANNHILDQGDQGLISTIQELKKSNISFVGAGQNLAEAKVPFYFSVSNKRYGIYACAEHEFSIATNDSPGANPFDALDSLDQISAMTDQCDYLIVLYHGGKEHYRYPSPYLQRLCRKMVEKGADLVVCQHSHCIGCEEKFQKGTIIYGQGNFIFPQNDNEFWNTSLLIEIDHSGKISYIPIKRTSCGTQRAKGNEKEKILSDFYKRSTQIQTDGFINEAYEQFAASGTEGYISFLCTTDSSILYRGINRLTNRLLQKNMVRKYLTKKQMGIINFVECEAHRELLITGLKLNDSGKR